MTFDITSTSSGESAAVPGPLVLCIDDEAVGLRVRRILLERAGYRVLVAPDGETGLHLFRTNPVQAVVLDFAMPGMSGGEVAAELRSLQPAIPILMLSAYTSLPAEIAGNVTVAMTKGEGAPALLHRLASLLPPRAN